MRSAETNGRGMNPRMQNLLAKQQYDLVKNPANGVIFYQNEEGDVTDIQADIIGPETTAYEGGVFRCKLVIESGFPQSAPKGYFMTKIFHPNVAPITGEICVNTLKRDWNPAKWSLRYILDCIRCLLIVPFPESSLNETAGREIMDDYDSFVEHARVYTRIHAKPNAAQKDIILERKKKEEAQSAAESKLQRQPTQSSSTTSTTVTAMQKPMLSTATSLVSQENSETQAIATVAGMESTQASVLARAASLPTDVTMHPAQLTPISNYIYASSAEKQRIVIEQFQGLSHSTSVPIGQNEEMKQAPPTVSVDLNKMVLSQLTNHPQTVTDLRDMTKAPGQNCYPVLSSDDVGAMMNKHNVLTASFQMKHQNSMPPMFQNQNMLEGCDQVLMQRRSSVLFKKKVETTKQKQDRYLRRI